MTHRPAHFRVTVIADQHDAERRGFNGSPSFLMDGADLLCEPAAPGTGTLACRIYRSPATASAGPARAGGICDANSNALPTDKDPNPAQLMPSKSNR